MFHWLHMDTRTARGVHGWECLITPSPQHTPPTTGTQVDQSVGFRPIEKTPPAKPQNLLKLATPGL